MKKIALILALACLTMAAASCSKDTPADTSVKDFNEIKENDVPDETKKNEMVYFDKSDLELERDPVYDGENLVLYFTNHSVQYNESAQCYIGMLSSGSADSYRASPVLDAYADMKTDDGYCGVALKPEENLPAGTYEFMVSINEYNVSFDLTIE